MEETWLAGSYPAGDGCRASGWVRLTPMPPPALIGTYSTPRFRYGAVAFCEVRGKVIVTGLSAAPIQWPVGKRPGGRARALVVYAGLAKATAETRAKMSASQKARGTRPPACQGVTWTPEEDEVLRSLPPRKAAIRLRRSLGAVYSRRHLLKFPDARGAALSSAP
jgi:hypothetical protein